MEATVHSHSVESFEGLLQRCRRGRGCSELWNHTIFLEHPVSHSRSLLVCKEISRRKGSDGYGWRVSQSWNSKKVSRTLSWFSSSPEILNRCTAFFLSTSVRILSRLYEYNFLWTPMSVRWLAGWFLKGGGGRVTLPYAPFPSTCFCLWLRARPGLRHFYAEGAVVTSFKCNKWIILFPYRLFKDK